MRCRPGESARNSTWAATVCLAGRHASALEAHPADILAKDPAACAIFRGGWVMKILDVMAQINAENAASKISLPNDSARN